MYNAISCKEDKMEQSAKDALFCAQSSTGCPEQLGLFQKTYGRHGVKVILEFMSSSNSGIAYFKKKELDSINLM